MSTNCFCRTCLISPSNIINQNLFLCTKSHFLSKLKNISFRWICIVVGLLMSNWLCCYDMSLYPCFFFMDLCLDRAGIHDCFNVCISIYTGSSVGNTYTFLVYTWPIFPDLPQVRPGPPKYLPWKGNTWRILEQPVDFYKPDALPAAQPTAVKHCRKTQRFDRVFFTNMVSAPHVKPTASQ